MAEKYEEEIEHWYFNLQATHTLLDYLCRDRHLKEKKFPNRCLAEVRDEKLIEKDRQLQADNENMENTASKKQLKEREEWAAIKQRQAILDEIEAEKMMLKSKQRKGDNGDDEDEVAGFADVRKLHETNEKKLNDERERLKSDSTIEKTKLDDHTEL